MIDSKILSDESINRYFGKMEWKETHIVDTDEIADPTADPLEIICKSDTIDARNNCVEKFKKICDVINPKAYEICKLHYIDNLSIRATAKKINLSVEWVRQILLKVKGLLGDERVCSRKKSNLINSDRENLRKTLPEAEIE